MILETYSLEDPKNILSEAYSFMVETPKDEKYFENVDNILLVTNKIALESMEKESGRIRL